MNIMPVLLFSLAMTVTPGPNNMLLTVSGTRFGFRRTLMTGSRARAVQLFLGVITALSAVFILL